MAPASKHDKTVDFLLTAKRFFYRARGENGDTIEVAVDKSGANKAAMDAINAGRDVPILVRQVKYLNNIVEQDHPSSRGDQADAQLQIVPVRRRRARRHRTDAHDPQGPVRNRRCRGRVVRGQIFALAGMVRPVWVVPCRAVPGEFRRLFNNATEPAKARQ